MRVVLDSNVIVSGLIKTDTPPGIILQACYDHRLTLVFTKTLLAEIGRVFHKASVRQFLRYSDGDISAVLNRLRRVGEVVPEQGYPMVVQDVPDNAVLGCAIDGGADVIVSGDSRHLQPLQSFRGIPIVSPREFVEAFLSR